MGQHLIQTHPAGWLEDVERRVSELASRPSINVYALIDCAFSEASYTALKQTQTVLQWRSLFNFSGSLDESVAAVSPTLIQLHANSANAWRRVLRLTDGLPMVSVVATPESLEDLVRRLQPWCVVNADGEYYCFRFSDTRRLPDIVATLNPQQHGQFLGPACAWFYRGRNGTWMDLPLAEFPQSAADEVCLSGSQCAYLITASEADEIIADISLYAPALIEKRTPSEVFEIVSQALNKAQEGDIGQASLYEWCGNWLRDPGLQHSTQLDYWLRGHKEGKLSFDDLLQSIKRHTNKIQQATH